MFRGGGLRNSPPYFFLECPYMRITLKNIIEFELLRKHSFNSFNVEDIEDVIALTYCMGSSEKKALIPFEQVLKVAKEHPNLLSDSVQQIGKELLYLSQFRETLAEVKDEQKEQKEIYIKDIVGRLALAGISVNYLMETCELHEIGVFINALEKQTREQMELQRFWHYIQLSPHLDKKTKMRDLIEFPWEAEKPREDNIITEEEKKMAQDLLNLKTL